MVMEKICDLHTHSVYSDGTYTPAQLLREAEELGLSAIALTDHNTVSGLPDFLAAAEKSSVEAIAGAEFSVDYYGTELHILALGLRPDAFGQVTDLMQQYHIRKDRSNRELVEALNRAGFSLDYDAIKASTPKGEVNRALIAAALLKSGYVSSVQEAFQKLLNPSCGYYTPPKRYEPAQILDFIRDLGAVSVLAHPLLNLSPERLRQFLEEMRACGPVGMEVFYSSYSPEETAIACAIADEFGLLYSGGSDFHGANKPHIGLGIGKGNLKIPYGVWDALRKTMKKTKV